MITYGERFISAALIIYILICPLQIVGMENNENLIQKPDGRIKNDPTAARLKLRENSLNKAQEEINALKERDPEIESRPEFKETGLYKKYEEIKEGYKKARTEHDTKEHAKEDSKKKGAIPNLQEIMGNRKLLGIMFFLLHYAVDRAG